MEARIISLIAGNYKISDLDNNEIFDAKPRGVIRIKGSSPKVGDLVTYTKLEDGLAIIEKVHERFNDLIRPLICNIDQALVTFSVKEPDLNLNLLDKFLVMLEYNEIKPIIIFNKWDLLSKEEEIKTNQIIDYYQSIGYHIIKTSAIHKIIPEIKELTKGKLSVITGQSGVGKSSILNALDESLNLATNDISLALNRGKHTTRHVELIKLFDGYIADTPGFGTIDFENMDEVSLSQNFIEFFKLSSKCKYNGCLHLNEPGCAVKQALIDNQILPSRYENYQSFNKLIKEKKK